MKHRMKSGEINYFRSSKYNINPPSQKLQDMTTWSSWIFKWQNPAETAFSEVEKYKEIAKFLGVNFPNYFNSYLLV